MTPVQPSKLTIVFVGALLLATAFILKSFAFGILWGAVTALAAWPLFERLTASSRYLMIKPLNSGSVAVKAALLFALVFVLAFVAPLVYAVYELVNVYSAGSAYFAKTVAQGAIPPPEILSQLPFGAKLKQYWLENITTSSGAWDALNRATHGKVLSVASVLWSQVMDKLLTVFVMLISFYFMLSNGSSIKARYRAIVQHWIGRRSVTYVDKGISALRGTINGIVLIGLVEGMLLAVPLVFGGMRAGLLIALCAGLMGVIPMLMPVLILPCLGYLYLTGETAWAIVGVVDLVLVWFVFENVLKPRIISNTVKVNTFLILAAMLGGMQVAGLVGLFIGPAVVAMAVGMLRDMAATALVSPPLAAVVPSSTT